jgi:hypothetical protein
MRLPPPSGADVPDSAGHRSCRPPSEADAKGHAPTSLHTPVKALAHGGKPVESIRDRAGTLIQYACLQQRIVSADADDDMRRIGREAAHLRRDIRHDRAVPGVQVCAPALRQKLAQLMHDVRIGADISAVVKHGVTKEYDALHPVRRPGLPWREHRRQAHDAGRQEPAPAELIMCGTAN